MKKCNKCNSIKSYSEYHKHSGHTDGLSSNCKKCVRIYNLNYHRTKKGLINTIYSHQLSKSKIRGYIAPSYNLTELVDWVFKQENFNKLYDDWVNSNYNKMLTPSIDRLNDYLPYSFENIRLVTWNENFYKHHKDRKEGRNNKHSKSVKSINVFTKEEVEYFSIREGARVTGCNQSDISKVCKGIYKQSKGYIWKYL